MLATGDVVMRTCVAAHRHVLPSRTHHVCPTCTCAPLVRVTCGWCEQDDIVVLAKHGVMITHNHDRRHYQRCNGTGKTPEQNRARKQSVLDLEIAALDVKRKEESRPTRKIIV